MLSAEKLFLLRLSTCNFLLLRITAVISSAVFFNNIFSIQCEIQREEIIFNFLAIFIISVALQLLKPKLNNVIPEDPCGFFSVIHMHTYIIILQ